jgi:hypothetical protein
MVELLVWACIGWRQILIAVDTWVLLAVVRGIIATVWLVGV